MFRPLTSTARRPRRGAILVVVLALLALFSVIALFFVFYADSEATASRYHREAQSNTGANQAFPFSSTDTANSALGQLVFGTSDVNGDVLSGLRGHDLIRLMFGGQGPGGVYGSGVYDGPGQFHENTPLGNSRALWPNYSALVTVGGVTYVLDPEWTGTRNASQLNLPPWDPSFSKTWVPKNAPYTYADLNNYLLASLSPATGEVLVPSLHRPWLFNLAPPSPLASGTQADWLDGAGRARTVRPRPVDQLTQAEIFSMTGSNTLPQTLTGPQANQINSYLNSQIAQGNIIPYPAANADGSYTGDIQNLRAGVGVQKNDSVLVDLGLPPKQWNGKWVKPLVSVLVTDLDGLLNLNAHGNVRNTLAGAGASKHTSYAGYGPYEVNLGAVLVNGEADQEVYTRYGSAGAAVGRNGLTAYPFDRSGTRLQAASLVNFDGTGAANVPPILLPGFTATPPNPFQISPTFNNVGGMTPVYFDDNTTAAKGQNHPLLYNPTDYGTPTTGAPRTFPHSDLRHLFFRYAADLGTYQDTDLNRAGLVGNSLIYTGYPGAQTYSGNSYRRDPAHGRRMLFTTLSTGLDRPGHVGNFDALASGSKVLQLAQPAPNPQNLPYQPVWVGLPATLPAPGTASGTSDFSPPSYRNARPVGPVDLNRPLTDYRSDPNVALGQPSTTNMADTTNSGNYLQAWADRHNLARDIFTRLVIATGANATIDPSGNPVIGAAAGSADYNALRYLAQVAVNMVDAVDSDDVITAFAWNPGAAWTTPNTVTAVDATTVQTIVTTAAATTPAGVVYGTEKPRLVINEAYGEVNNDPNDAFAGTMNPAMGNARVRFWVELMNPTNTPYSGGAVNAPLGDGSVTLFNAATSTSAYQLVIMRDSGNNAAATLLDPTNAAGAPPTPAANTGFTYNFATAAANQRVVSPAAGNWAYAGQATGTRGFIVVGASDYTAQHQDSGGTNTVEFRPNVAAAPYNQMIVGSAIGMGAPNTQMEYDLGSAPTAAALEADDATMNPLINLRRHVVVLRRLANPYQPFNATTNPFVTVDYMDWVPAYDAVARGSAGTDTMNRAQKGAPGITPQGFEQVDGTSGGTRRASVGKVQPYAGYATGTGYTVGNNTFPTIGTFPTSMVIRQNPNAANLPPAGQPLHTFFRNNGMGDGTTVPAPAAQTYTVGTPAVPGPLTPPAMLNNETIMAPFDWLVHFDRPVANQLELLHLQAGKPFELSQNFIRYVSTSPTTLLRRDLGQVPWLGVTAATGLPGYDTTNGRTNNGLFRALDLLRVKPWMYGVGLGGRTFGRVNINAIQDGRVLQALLDPPPPPWTQNVPYGVGQTVTCNGNVYQCTTAGTSSTTGNGPTGTGTNIMDGTVVWNFARFASANLFNSNDVSMLWGSYVLGSRTLLTTNMPSTPVTKLADGTPVNVPYPGPTFDDLPTNPNVDRPFKALGVGEFAAGGQYGYTQGAGLQDTLLRTNPAGQPLVWSTNANATHPYFQAEMARKMLNNVTTVSNAFAVTITVVFHEVRVDSAGNPMANTEIPGYPRYLLGKEAYQDVPGDLRQQFFAVVDRSNAGLVPGSGGLQSQPYYGALDQAPVSAPTSPPMGYLSPPANSFNLYLADAVPVVNPSASPAPPPPGGVTYTTNANAYMLVVYADGQPINLAAGSVLVVGVGANQETVGVNWVNQDGSLNVSGLGKLHGAGECVANVVPGNPGIPGVSAGVPAFDRLTNLSSSPYKAVVPYVARIPRDQ